MPFKKGQSGNPKGKVPGTFSACAKAKADYSRVYQKHGGYKRFLKYMQDNKQLWPEENAYPLEGEINKMPLCGHPDGLRGTLNSYRGPQSLPW